MVNPAVGNAFEGGIQLKRLRVLQVGVGARGQVWDEVIRDCHRTEVAGYVDIDPAALDSMAARYPGEEVYTSTDLGAALDDVEPDVLVLVTPPETHGVQIEAACQRSIPVLAEKPLAEDLHEAVALTRMAEEANIPLSLCLNFRYLEVTQGMKRMIREETLGAPDFMHFVYIRNRDGKRSDINRYPLYMEHPMLLEQSIHHFDLIRYVTDSEVQWVDCHTWNPPWSMYDHDSNVSALMALENGVHVDYIGTWTSGWDDMQFQWRVDCPEGVIIQDRLFADLKYAAMSGGDPDFEYEKGGGGGGGQLHPVPGVEEDTPFYDDTLALLEAFAGAVQDSTQPQPCSAEDHLRSLATVFACIRSAERGERVQLEEIYREYGIRT